MKNLLFSVAALLIAGCILLSASIQPNKKNSTVESIKPEGNIEGAWELVWGKYGDKVRNPGKPFQFKLFSGKHYSLIMEDGNGGWSRAGAGTYELEGDIYREKFLYNSTREYVGATVEWRYIVTGDTLVMEGPLKVVDAAGNDASHHTGGLNNMREIRVRAK